MKNNKIAALTAMVSALMLITTACGAPAEETTAVTTVATTAATTAEESTTAKETTTEQNTIDPKVGAATADGKFTSASGRFEIMVPEGWTIDPDSDEEIITMVSADETDFIEIITASGEIDSYVEKMPASSDEFKMLIAKGDEDLNIDSYNVVDKADGAGQTYQYSVSYGAEEADIKYLSISCDYDLGAKEFISATATIETDGDDVVKSVKESMESFKILK